MFHHAREALEHLERESGAYGLIVSDIAMPELTGVELVKALHDRDIHLAVILCSAYTGAINWRMAGAVGIRSILMKPVRRAQLAEKVSEVLDAESEAALLSA